MQITKELFDGIKQKLGSNDIDQQLVCDVLSRLLENGCGNLVCGIYDKLEAKVDAIINAPEFEADMHKYLLLRVISVAEERWDFAKLLGDFKDRAESLKTLLEE